MSTNKWYCCILLLIIAVLRRPRDIHFQNVYAWHLTICPAIHTRTLPYQAPSYIATYSNTHLLYAATFLESTSNWKPWIALCFQALYCVSKHLIPYRHILCLVKFVWFIYIYIYIWSVLDYLFSVMCFNDDSSNTFFLHFWLHFWESVAKVVMKTCWTTYYYILDMLRHKTKRYCPQ